MPRKKKTEVESKEIESKEIESKEMEMESTPKEVKDNRTLAQKFANYKRPLRRI